MSSGTVQNLTSQLRFQVINFESITTTAPSQEKDQLLKIQEVVKAYMETLFTSSSEKINVKVSNGYKYEEARNTQDEGWKGVAPGKCKASSLSFLFSALTLKCKYCTVSVNYNRLYDYHKDALPHQSGAKM